MSDWSLRIVDIAPEILEPSTLYVSFGHSTAIHLCACGCGNEVVTPLSPREWQLSFEGEVSLDPSIGNWRFPCQSHYYIAAGRTIWVPKWRTRSNLSEEAAAPSKGSKATKRRWWRFGR